MANPSLFDRIVAGSPLAGLRLLPAPSSGSPGNTATSGTISHNGKNYVRVNTAAAITGVILQQGLTDGQMLLVENVSANSITFAAAATSFVRAGALAIIGANQGMLFVWNVVDTRWTAFGPFDTASVFYAGNGTVSLPSVAFASDTDTGIYRIGANNLGVAAGGAKVLDIAAQLAQFVGELKSTTQLTQTKSANYSMLITDVGYRTYVDTDAVVITLPATVVGYTYEFCNSAADGASGMAISPNASDKIMGAGLSAQDNKDLINTKATSKKGDLVRLIGDGVDGWYVQEMTGTWAREA